MARTWKLETETKGTGASVVPLRPEGTGAPSPSAEPIHVPRRPRPRPVPEPAPREARRFRVVDVETRRVLAQDADVRATLATLGTVRSSVDVRVDVWQAEARRWRPLTLGEQRLLWQRRSAPGA
jgi:hypothetical protein